MWLTFVLRPTAAATYDEQDGDFLFTRGSKRQKTGKEKIAAAKNPPQPPPEPEPTPAPVVKKPRGRPVTGKKRAPSPPLPQQKDDEVPATTSRRPTRRKRDSSPPAPDEPVVVPKKRTARRTRSSTEQIAGEEPEEEPPPPAASRTNGIKATKDGGAKKTSGRPSRKKQQAPVEDEQAVQTTPETTDKTLEKDPNATKIALPFSDTPINNRNKEFRKKGGAGAGGGRRSSMSMRGRRASSLIDSGHSAIPHREVDPSGFYKHIEAEGLSEPRRMKQLLTWCGERALSEKPKHGTAGANAVLGGKSRVLEDAFLVKLTDAGGIARAIQDQLLKDFGSNSEFSDWFSREDEPSSTARSKRPVVIKPNPVNVDHEQRIAALEARIKRLVCSVRADVRNKKADRAGQIKRNAQVLAGAPDAFATGSAAVCTRHGSEESTTARILTSRCRRSQNARIPDRAILIIRTSPIHDKITPPSHTVRRRVQGGQPRGQYTQDGLEGGHGREAGG